ncbi:MAG: glycosyltransferase family 4 protein [Bacteroidales bacterium]|nr:glycosyltransferase family 4 protein [Bacteroidales bacterium]
MNIAVIVDNEFSTDVRVYNECLILSDAGHKVFVLCLNFSKMPDDEPININLSVSRISINRKFKNLLFALVNTIDIYSYWWSDKIDTFIKKNHIDILHVHDLYMAKAGYLAKKKNAIPMILDLHEYYPYAVLSYQWMNKFPSKYIIRPWAWKRKEGKFLRYPYRIVVLSNHFKSQLLEKYNYLTEDQFIVYPNVPNISELLAYPINNLILEKQDSFILFYFGGVSKRRGIFVAIDALKLLVDKIPEIRLLIIGPVDKAERKVFDLAISNEKVRDHIIYYAWKDISLLPSYIRISDICLSPIEKNPQHESGIANKVYQYMLFEKPVLVSDCKPQADLINRAKCGLVHKWDSVEDFSEKVLELFRDKELACKMGVNGRQEILTHYNSIIMGRNLINAYRVLK